MTEPCLWESLSFAQRVTVWSLRLWLARQQGDSTAAARSCKAFEIAAAGEALAPLDRLMGCIASLASRPVRLAPVGEAALSHDEALLLRALSMARQDGPVDGLLVLRSMFTPEGCRIVRHHCAEYAQALAESGFNLADAPTPVVDTVPLDLPLRNGTVRR